MNVTMSDMYCTKCGRKNIPVPRKRGQEREPGHLKKMYCIYCKKQVNMVEVRGFGSYTIDDFLLEFEYKNFDKDGNRKLSWGDFRTHIHSGGGILK